MKSISLIAAAVIVFGGCSQDSIQSDSLSASDGAFLAASGVDGSAAKHHSDGMAEYEVTIVNMSHSQPFSPGVLVTHDGSASVFDVGSPASEGIRLIAENGDPSTALTDLASAAGVSDVVNTGAPVHRKGGPGPATLTSRITAEEGAEYLSMAIMLICTNDGFVGLDGVKLPKGPETAVYFPNAYDAGTEANDELYSSIVDPCSAIGPVSVAPDGANDRPASADNVEIHPGIAGTGDLDADAYNWRNKIARVTVKRVR